MATSSTLKALKKEDGPINPRDMPVPIRSNGLIDRLLTWWQSIWRRRWLSVATAWLICLVGWAAITLWPTNFVASTVVYADLAELTEPTSGSEPGAHQPVAALRSLLLTDERLDSIRNEIPLGQEKSQSLQDDIMLRSTVPAIFMLAYEHKNPDSARQVLDMVVSGFQTDLEETKKQALLAASALDDEISDHQRRLQTTEADLVTFKRSNADHLDGASTRSAELALLREEIGSLEEQLSETIADRDELALELAKARAPEDDGAADAPTRSPEEIEVEKRTLGSQLTKLQERYADSHPYVVSVLDAIKSLNAEAALSTPADDSDETPIDREELEQQHGELIAEVSALNSRLGSKRREIELLEALTRTTTSVEAELVELETQKGALETALADLQQRRSELEEEKGARAEQEAFRLMKQPELPTDPVGPSRLMALAAVLLGGAGIGAFAAVACNRVKGVFESAWQLKQRFDVGVLGTIPEVMTPGERKQLGYSRLAFGAACLALIGVFSGLAIAELTNKLAPFGEQVRTQLLG